MSSWPEHSAQAYRLNQPDRSAPYAETWIYLPPVHRSSTAHLVVAWLGAVLTAGYLLPWAIGATRNRTNCVSTALVNILLGWTLVGWVIALVMACGSEPQQPVAIRTAPGAPFALPTQPALAVGPYAVGPYAVGPYAQPTYAQPTYAQPAYPLYPVGQPTSPEATIPLPPHGSRGDLR